MSHFNQPNIERKNCVRSTKWKRLLEMCFVPHVKMNSVFTFQSKKRLVSTQTSYSLFLNSFNNGKIYGLEGRVPCIWSELFCLSIENSRREPFCFSELCWLWKLLGIRSIQRKREGERDREVHHQFLWKICISNY